MLHYVEESVEWFRIVAVHRAVDESCYGTLSLGEGDVVVHAVSADGDVYGVDGVGIDVLETVFRNLVCFERISIDLRGVWFLRFGSMYIDIESPTVSRRC